MFLPFLNCFKQEYRTPSHESLQHFLMNMMFYHRSSISKFSFIQCILVKCISYALCVITQECSSEIRPCLSLCWSFSFSSRHDFSHASYSTEANRPILSMPAQFPVFIERVNSKLQFNIMGCPGEAN